MPHVASNPSSSTTASLWLLLLLQDMQDMRGGCWVGSDWFRAETLSSRHPPHLQHPAVASSLSWCLAVVGCGWWAAGKRSLTESLLVVPHTLFDSRLHRAGNSQDQAQTSTGWEMKSSSLIRPQGMNGSRLEHVTQILLFHSMQPLEVPKARSVW